MARWQPDAQGRLQLAAFELFRERGYAEVTVAEIADRAGLTKRTFFNHFPDKREVLFAGAQDFEAGIVKQLTDAPDDLAPIDAAVAALTRSSLELAQYSDYARIRRDLIASSLELQERDLIKMTSLAFAIAGALRQRHVPARTATAAAQAAVAVFSTAYGDWVDDSAADFGALMQRALAEFRQAVGSTRGTGS
ncbi:MAG: TetR/AcrR family transcriptional regulator [Actinomycetota bacterium]|nr:TetR/AcrR family transcriptional regulator [Actinomycetota bacterium]